MKPIQFLLIPVLIVVLLVFVPRLKRSFMLQGLLAAGGIILIGFVSMPDLSTKIANLVGIGRGVDLILYVGMLALGILGLSLQLKFRRIEERQEAIIRHLSITNQQVIDSKNDA